MELKDFLATTPPTVTRPVPEDATNSRHNRKPGAIGWLLDPAPIEAYLRDFSYVDPETRLNIGELLLLRSPKGELAVIGSEGVGIETTPLDDADRTIRVYVGIGFYWQDIAIPHDVIQEAITGEGADVAGFIRLFGDRLDTNAYIWRNFVNNG